MVTLADALGTMDGVGHAYGDNAADAATNTRLAAAAATFTNLAPCGVAANLDLPRPVTAQFSFRQNTSASTFKVQFGNNTAGAGRTSRLKKGSFLRWKAIT